MPLVSLARHHQTPGDSRRAPPPNLPGPAVTQEEPPLEKPRGWAIADFLEKLEGLMARGRYGSGQLLGTAAGVVTERAREEAEILVAEGGVEERVVTELFRVLRLVEMDVEMVKAAVKEHEASPHKYRLNVIQISVPGG